MIREIWFEIIKFKSQKKNYVVIVGHIVFLALCYFAFKTSKLHFLDRALASNKFDVNVFDYVDGLFFARAGLVPTFLVLMPIFICTLAGGVIAGEIEQGSLKLIASRPRSRTNIILAKIFAIYNFNLIFCIYFAVASVLIGIALYGYNPIQLVFLKQFNLGNDIALMSSPEALLRYFAFAFYCSFSLMALGSIALFFSTIFNKSTTATIAAITIYFVCFIVAQLPFATEIKPYLLSELMGKGFGVFWLPDIPWYLLAKNMGILALYICGFSSLSICHFNLRDIQ
ncbi:MAG: ABC transporter permease subunit [Lentisphaeria bacterium]